MKRMAKKSLVAVVCAALAVVMLGCVLVGCSGGKEEKGTWYCSSAQFFDLGALGMATGIIFMPVSDTMTVYTDDTFVLTDSVDSWHQVDTGITLKSSFTVVISGTVETVSENAELGESTIRISDVASVKYNGEELAYKGNRAQVTVNRLKGKEILLGSDGHMVVNA